MRKVVALVATTAIMLFAFVAVSQAYTGHAGCPTLNSGYFGYCDSHTDVAQFTLTINGPFVISFAGHNSYACEYATDGRSCTASISLGSPANGRPGWSNLSRYTRTPSAYDYS
jgi:hypothetical protein